jgi:hypothetical protein
MCRLEVLEDLEFLPLPLNSILFPGLSLPIAAHSGFLITHSLCVLFLRVSFTALK